MTEMEKYIKSVRRHLNLPKDVKNRVRSDFVSAIHARQEAGQKEEEILAELGDAKRAAADLNEQMKEFAYRKSPWRFLFAAVAAYGAANLLAKVWGQILFWLFQIQMRQESFSVGVIGGADGPTAIFVTTPDWTSWLIPVILLTVGIWGFLRLRKCTQK